MDRSRQQLERDLIRTETSLQFMQKEHQKTLSGLHEEIAQLTKKYSGMHEFSFQMYRFYLDMQFLMAMQADTSNLAEQQKDIIKRLQSDCDCLQSQLSQSEQRESEMASQLSWERVQHDNLVACLKRQLEEKDVLIVKLKKDQETNVCAQKIIIWSQRLYIICDWPMTGPLTLSSYHSFIWLQYETFTLHPWSCLRYKTSKNDTSSIWPFLYSTFLR